MMKGTVRGTPHLLRCLTDPYLEGCATPSPTREPTVPGRLTAVWARFYELLALLLGGLEVLCEVAQDHLVE